MCISSIKSNISPSLFTTSLITFFRRSSNSPLNFAHLLEGEYLLIHGSADDNVHLQNTMRMVEELIQNNKQFEWMIYPDKNHGIYGGNSSIHLYNKMTTFIEDKL